MNHDDADSSVSGISTQTEFASALEQLLLSAVENDLDPRGAWECRNGEDHPDFEALITELSKPD